MGTSVSTELDLKHKNAFGECGPRAFYCALNSGGDQIKQACSDYISQHGMLEEGEVFLSPGGNLTAKGVIHVVGPTWQGGDQREKKRLEETVSKLMKQAGTRGFKSIAIPAISCGTFG